MATYQANVGTNENTKAVKAAQANTGATGGTGPAPRPILGQQWPRPIK